MENIYFASTLMWNASPEELVQTALKYEAAGIELWAQQAECRGYDPETLRTLAKQAGIGLIVHAKSWDLNYAALNRAVREASVEEIKSSVDLARLVGAKEVTVHPPRYTLAETQEARDLAYGSICQFAGYAASRGIKISMEIMEHIPKEMATSPKEMRAIVRALETELAFTVDLAHCLTEKEFWDNIRDMGRVSKVHITNKCGKKLHTPLPEGDFRMENIYPELVKMGIPMVVEGYDESRKYDILNQDFKFIQTLKEKKNEEESNSTFNHNGNFSTYGLRFC